MDDAPCISCSGNITRRMHAVSCVVCNGWQHRKCNTGISFDAYKRMVRGEVDIPWRCGPCSVPDIPIPMHVDDDDDAMLEDQLHPEETDDTPNPDLEVDDAHIHDGEEGIFQEANIADRSFNIENRDIQRVTQVLDRSVQDPPLNADEIDEQVKYTDVLGATKKGGRKLASIDGFTFSIKRQRGDYIYWRCTARGRKEHGPCPAVVKQFGDTYVRGQQKHNHQADPGAVIKVTITAKAKQIAKDQVLRSAGDIAETVMKEMRNPGDHCLPKMHNLSRLINYTRESMRPKDPMTKDFQLNEDFIKADKFLVKDIRTDDGERHIILATENQLKLLHSATRWFIDGTFKIVKRPFQQLMSIHPFIKSGNCTKQIPLAFCLMTRRTKQDYVRVFQALRDAMPQNPADEWFMMDYESAVWQAVREVFPHSIQKGCVFHFTQALYRKILTLGLSTTYVEREDKYRFLRKVMSLPFLPAEHIRQAFEMLEDLAQESGHDGVIRFVSYVRTTWLDGHTWRLENWCVFQQTVRTNNDVEGWHHRINGRVGKVGPSFYVLVPLLLAEAATIDLQVQLVSEQSLNRFQKQSYKRTHAKLFELWENYEDNLPGMTTSKLLREVSYIIGFAPRPDVAENTT